jgi:hypothetical protein
MPLDSVFVRAKLSVTCTETEYVPAVVGVPDKIPVPGVCASPGTLPVMFQLYGGVPPAAVNVTLYGDPTIPFGVVNGEIDSGALITIFGFTVAVCDALSVTFAVTWYVPVVVGVPLTLPLPGVCATPGGRPDIWNV